MKPSIKDILSVIGFLGGAAMFIFGLGIKKANSDNNNTELNKTVTELRSSVEKVNTTLVLYGQIQQEQTIQQGNFVMQQKKLTNTVTSLALKVSESPAEFVKIMEGGSFEVVQDEPMKSVFPNPQIRWKKVPKDSVK